MTKTPSPSCHGSTRSLDDLADSFVLDRYFLAVGVHLESSGRLLDLGMDLNLTDFLRLFVSNQAFFA